MTRLRAAAVILVAAIAGFAANAAALEEEAITLPARTTIEADYGPIPAPDPATVTVGGVVTPAECAALPSCALLPIDIVAPTGLEPGDDFFVVIEVSFDAPSGAEDLDVFLFDDGQTDANEGGDGSTYTEKGSSASADNPEKIQVYEPLLGRYNLVVQNFTGAGVFWHLKAQSIVGEFDPPFESLAPAPGSGTTNPNNKPTTTTAPTSTTMPTTTTVSIPEGVVLPDADFEGGEFDPEAALDQFALDDETLDQLRAGREAESPSTFSVVLWMVVLPGLLLAGAAAFIASRRARLRVKLSR